MTARLRVLFAVLPVLFAGGLLAAACGGGNGNGSSATAAPTRAPAANPTSPPASNPTSAPAANPTSSAGGAAANSITISNFTYSPARFNAVAGQQVRLTITNQDSAPHTFTIQGVADSGPISAGESKTVTFTPSQAGNLTWFCSIHGQARMSGQVIVSGTSGQAAPVGGQTTSGSAPASTPATTYDYGY
jgi:plastocyanin